MRTCVCVPFLEGRRKPDPTPTSQAAACADYPHAWLDCHAALMWGRRAPRSLVSFLQGSVGVRLNTPPCQLGVVHAPLYSQSFGPSLRVMFRVSAQGTRLLSHFLHL